MTPISFLVSSSIPTATKVAASELFFHRSAEKLIACAANKIAAQEVLQTPAMIFDSASPICTNKNWMDQISLKNLENFSKLEKFFKTPNL